jgi:hypothetical protein
MLHPSSRLPTNWIGRPHIIAFSADDILAAAIFLGSIVVREAARQVKEAACRCE